jgi:zinc protease
VGLPNEDDEALGHAVLDASLWEGHPYAHPVEGAVSSLRAITLDDVTAHRQGFFTQARALVGLGGAVDDDLLAHVKERLGSLPRGTAWTPRELPPAPGATGLRIVIAERATDSTPITLGHRWELTRAHPDFVPLWVANSAFGEHRTLGGRLFSRVRELRGLNYGAYSYLEHFEEEGEGPLPLLNVPQRQQAFRVWLRPVTADERVFALRLALREVARFAEAGITAAEFSQSRDYLRGAILFQRQGLSRRVAWMLDDVLNGTPDFLDAVLQRLDSVTLEEANRAVKRQVRPGDLHVSMLASDGAALRDALIAGAPSPRVRAPYADASLLAEDAEVARWPVPLRPVDVIGKSAPQLFQ